MSSARTGSARDLYELKVRAEEYYKENEVPKRMENIINSMFIDNPPDVYGHLVNFFQNFAKVPVITKLTCRQAFDSSGQPTTQTDVYCMVRNEEKLISTCLTPSCLSDMPEFTKKDPNEAEGQESVKLAINLINTDINNRLEGLDPTSQTEIDTIAYDLIVKLVEEKEVADAANAEKEEPVEEEKADKVEESNQGKRTPKGKGKGTQIVIIPNEDQEKLHPGSSMVCAVSQAVCTAAACLKHVPLYEHIASLTASQVPVQYTLPLTMVTILQSGKTAAGKSNCVKEFMVVPRPGMSAHEGIEKILGIYHYISKGLVAKGGTKKGITDYLTAKNVSEIGALCPVFDKPEQGLDMILDAMSALEIRPGEDLHIALNAAGHEMFDLEKGKYEVVVGQLKSPEDLVDFWNELLGRYPAVNVIIDPMRKEDRVSWLKLCDKLTSHCYVMGDYGYHRPGRLIRENLEDVYGQYKTSAMLLRLEKMNTITDLIQCVNTMKEADNDIVVGTCKGETTDDIVVDFAVGMNVKYLKVGAPCRGERISKLNRLLQIENRLEEKGILGCQSEHVYHQIEVPPTPEPEEPDPVSPSSTRKDGKKK